ncbi:hypothetical protein [Acinetobacter courvalinii]|uniref:hypothetical protein n=1 Tax=Acinetobacter courvalinii TaxID=280147 RepID=UPI0002CF6528|nr:hypothetical protein [Acinetobacter courvalinii]ENX05449.1 hypothetical protein F898_02393 [Acinetobacter courvalinii]MBJ9955424.1 hypothetical protein [Acinetobacter courvalinii]
MNKKQETDSVIKLQSSFISLLSPEILLAHLDINHNDWVAYDSDWFYKVEKKDIALPFQRILYITNNMKNIEICNNEQEYSKTLDAQQATVSSSTLVAAEKIIRAILNLADTTPIENWTQDTENRTLVEDIIASNHIKILAIV